MRPIPHAGTAALSAALAFALADIAQAGEPEILAPTTPPIETVAETEPAPEIHLNLIDQKLALSLAIDAQAQIEMAEFALKSINDERLQRLVADRLDGLRSFAAELNTLTDGRTGAALARAQREIERDRSPDARPQKRFRLLSVRYATAMLARIHLEILQEYATLQRGALAAKTAEDFDRHYLRRDLLNQMQILATLKVFESQASADFAGVIHRARTRAHEEFEAANQLLVQLEVPTVAEKVPLEPEVVGSIAQP